MVNLYDLRKVNIAMAVIFEHLKSFEIASFDRCGVFLLHLGLEFSAGTFCYRRSKRSKIPSGK